MVTVTILKSCCAFYFDRMKSKQCMTCGNPTTNKSGFCSVKGWDSCKNIFIGEYGSKLTVEIKSEQK